MALPGRPSSDSVSKLTSAASGTCFGRWRSQPYHEGWTEWMNQGRTSGKAISKQARTGVTAFH
jgi:hypothetical protein